MVQSLRWLLALVIDARDTKFLRNLGTKASDMTNGKLQMERTFQS